MPSQISPPIEYFDGDPINAEAFNGHVKNATLQNGSITEQTAITDSVIPTIDRLDSLVVYDESEVTTNKLRKVQVESLFSSGAPVVADYIETSVINAEAESDIDVTPYVGILVSGKNYFSLDGLTVTVTSTEHGFESGTLVEFYSSSPVDHTGRFQITVLTADTFSYNNGKTVAAAAGSGVLSYKKAATVNLIGNLIVNDDSRVAGDSFIGGNLKVDGSASVGSLTIGGKTPLTQEDSFLGISVKTVTLPNGTAFGTVDYQTQSFNVPPGETWTFVWTAITDQYNSTGNTRPNVAYTWNILVGSLTGSLVDTAAAGNQGYGGTSSVSRSIVVRNEGTTGNTHQIISPTVNMTYAGTMNLTWSAKPPYGWSKWEKGHINLILFRQKTASINYGHPQVL